MTLKDLQDVVSYAKAAQISLTHERTGYFQHIVHIGESYHTAREEAIAHIDLITGVVKR